MHRIAMFAAAAIVLAAPAPALRAQTAAASPPTPALDFRALQRQCDAEAARTTRTAAALSQAGRIVAAAEAEFRAFDGHVIDHTGRIARFGSVEIEAASVSTEQKKLRALADVPWRRVARYWELVEKYKQGLAPDSAPPSIGVSPHSSLSVNWIDNGFSQNLADTSIARNILLALLVRGIDELKGTITIKNPGFTASSLQAHKPFIKNTAAKPQDATFDIDLDNLKEVLKEAVVRGALTDVAWSAVFISAVMQQAGVPANAFKQNASHVFYIAQAFLNARHMLEPQPAKATYRACDIYRTRARAGDIVCYHRQREYDEAYATSRKTRTEFQSIARATLAEEGHELPFVKSHCDIVVAVETSAAKIVTIGGNVNQSVTRRRINTDAKGVLLRHQGPGCTRLTQRLAGKAAYSPASQGKIDSDALAEQRRCNLNMQGWFALLQHVDPAPRVD